MRVLGRKDTVNIEVSLISSYERGTGYTLKREKPEEDFKRGEKCNV